MADIQDPGATPEAMSIKKVGVIGAGQMGSGIAHVAAVAGIDIVMNDIGQEQLDKAIANIDKNLERQVQREKISAADKQDALDRLSGSADAAAAQPSTLKRKGSKRRNKGRRSTAAVRRGSTKRLISMMQVAELRKSKGLDGSGGGTDGGGGDGGSTVCGATLASK